ncbi:McrB family protein [Aliarcobacter butzleri]|uniref:McrB family protein n=1 Tax=Aliarcobacter butzleri TaxID=28197 RepID=UPI0021B3E533|nr:AAA family ATPase [Aliarcobacter butzleri]MCT7562996.1 AAA family ATPase [Aliarcobacter butzleri]MCT7611785.1 AAA family ATPase [Aliarcobacter butzleri]MCT7640220.1 AAA family ATPase [Aliarcobacter butzleri]
MTEQELINKHKEIFNFLLEYKKEHSNFVFSPRQKHNDVNNNHLMCRLCKGYIFQGNENYIFVPLYKKVDTSNHTKTIGFVYTQNEQYIEIVFNNIEGNEKFFYDEINEYLKKSDKVIVKKIHNFKFQYILNESLEKNLLYFISDVKGRIDSLIIKYGLENEYFISEKEFQDLLNKIEMNPKIIKDKEDTMKINLKTKNIMLYGAPGVGKTHNYKRLITMIENGESERTIFDTISKNETTNDFDNSIFETIKNEKRIEFVTFHQSYSYEDFIEGFRPQDNGNIKLEDGIFKILCHDAKINLFKSVDNKEILFNDALNLILKEKIENQENVKIDLKRNNSFYNIYDFNDKTIYFEKQNGDKSHTLSLKTLEKMYYEGTNNIINGGLAPYYNPLLEELLKLKNKFKVEKSELKNFYIVIDEINRGNISKIFGELITLIEEDKRDDYEVTLPYSKEKFKIPSNLYIIATMNSTDKSIATIDIALRRRFTFLKMKPNPNLVQKDNVRQLMKELNQYISKSFLGEDYQLGHSYFIGDDIDIEFIKEYKIKPLLEEYFYSEAITPDEIIKKAKSEYKEEVIKSSDIENKENQND